MAKAKLKLSLDQDSDTAAVMTSEEAKELADHLKDCAKQADTLANDKNEGRVSMEMGDSRVIISASREKIEKDDDVDES